MNLQERVEEYSRQNGLLSAGDTVLIGVSGGADSVCLFLLLCGLRDAYDLKLHTICVDHGLREEAAEEAAYVKELSERYGAEFHTVRIDVESYARSEHLSIEEAARDLRYAEFERCADGIGATKIAVAHTRDDQAETVLYRLFRGTGLKGLPGMRAKSGRRIRPLLAVARAEIEEELAKRGVRYCTDASNESDDYARNCIRHHILPEAVKINAQAAAHIAAAAGQLLSAEDYIRSQAETAYVACVTEYPSREEGSGTAQGLSRVTVRVDGFLSLHPCLQERVLFTVMERLCGRMRDISAVHIRDLKGIFTLETGKRLDLPYRMTAVKRREYVEVYAAGTSPYYKKGVSENGLP